MKHFMHILNIKGVGFEEVPSPSLENFAYYNLSIHSLFPLFVTPLIHSAMGLGIKELLASLVGLI